VVGGGRDSIDAKPPPLRAVFLLDIVGFTGPTRLQPWSAFGSITTSVPPLLQFDRVHDVNSGVNEKIRREYLWIL
jgi:hypothetical protein